MEDLSLARIEEVRLALEAAVTVQEVKGIRDAADAMHRYSEQQRVGKDIQLKLAEYVVRAETKLGEILHAAKEAGQISKTNTLRRDHIPNKNMMFTLKEAGIDPKLSMRAQQLAAIPKADFEKNLGELKEKGTITTNALLQMSREAKPPAKSTKKPPQPPKRDDRTDKVMHLADQDLTLKEIASRTGVPQRMARNIVRDERNRRAGKAEAPEITPDMISSMTQKEKYERLVRQYETQFAARVDVAARALAIEMRDRMVEATLVHWREEQKRLGWALKSRQGIMSRKDYRRIWACLHPDRTDHFEMDPKTRAEYRDAWELFRSAEKLLLNEHSSPTPLMHIPSKEELVELRRKDAAARKAKRSGKSTEVQPK